VVRCGGRGTGAANQALLADEGVKIVALGDAFRDRVDSCYENLNNRYGDTGRIDVPEEHKFAGFDAYKHVIDLCDVVILAGTPGFRPKHFEYAVDKAGMCSWKNRLLRMLWVQSACSKQAKEPT
jgi:hypothetical protein